MFHVCLFVTDSDLLLLLTKSMFSFDKIRIAGHMKFSTFVFVLNKEEFGRYAGHAMTARTVSES